MVSAPLLTVGVPVDLPQTQAKSLSQDQEPLTLSVNQQGEMFLQSSKKPIPIAQLVDKLKAVTAARAASTSASSCAAIASSTTARS